MRILLFSCLFVVSWTVSLVAADPGGERVEDGNRERVAREDRGADRMAGTERACKDGRGDHGHGVGTKGGGKSEDGGHAHGTEAGHGTGDHEHGSGEGRGHAGDCGHDHDAGDDHDHGDESKGERAGHDHGCDHGHGHDHEAPLSPDRIANTIVLDETGVKNLGIRLATAEKREFETTVFAIGRIEEIPARHMAVSSRIAGRALRVHAFEGDQVEAGQVLVDIESRQPGNPPPVIQLKAPQPGLVIVSSIHVGQPVEPDKQLFDISDRSKMWAVARIAEQEAGEIHVGAKARIRVPALGEKVFEAPLDRFGVNADPETGTIQGIFVLPNEKKRLQPGMRAEFSIVTRIRSGVLCVPKSSVQGDPARRVVYVKDPELENAFVRTPVVLGEQNDQYVEVLEGLKPGDQVVTRGSYPLGFAGGGGGGSLKEALDAAHGHKHAEDGSELDEKSEDGHEDHGSAGHSESGGAGKLNLPLAIYAGIVTILLFSGLPRQKAKGACESPGESPDESGPAEH